MHRTTLAALAIVAAAGTAVAQESRDPNQIIGQVDAAEYIRGILQNEHYDPRDRQRARNFSGDLESATHYRSTIFEGRRVRSTRGTGLRLPDLIDRDAE